MDVDDVIHQFAEIFIAHLESHSLLRRACECVRLDMGALARPLVEIDDVHAILKKLDPPDGWIARGVGEILVPTPEVHIFFDFDPDRDVRQQAIEQAERMCEAEMEMLTTLLRVAAGEGISPHDLGLTRGMDLDHVLPGEQIGLFVERIGSSFVFGSKYDNVLAYEEVGLAIGGALGRNSRVRFVDVTEER